MGPDIARVGLLQSSTTNVIAAVAAAIAVTTMVKAHIQGINQLLSNKKEAKRTSRSNKEKRSIILLHT